MLLIQVNDFNCTCADGFMGNRCTININECESNPCGINSVQCIDGRGTFTCICKSGFTGKYDKNSCFNQFLRNKVKAYKYMCMQFLAIVITTCRSSVAVCHLGELQGIAAKFHRNIGLIVILLLIWNCLSDFKMILQKLYKNCSSYIDKLKTWSRLHQRGG